MPMSRTTNDTLDRSQSQAAAPGRERNVAKRRWEIQAGNGAIRLFSSRQIREATNNFDRSQLIREHRFWGLYKGTLSGFKHPLAIKAPKLEEERSINMMINEIAIAFSINHRNVVKLIGVCLEDEKRLYSVREYFPNGTLGEYLMNGWMPWRFRLKVAIEIANGLAYIHSSLWEPIIHGDISPNCIHFDNDYTARIFDFDVRSAASDEVHISSTEGGTMGYLDPEYIYKHRLSCKSDVYSFGVILVQLLTRKPAIDFTEAGECTLLSQLFISSLKERTLEQIFNVEVLNEDTHDEMKLVASLAAKCLELKSEDRPSMVEIAMTLEQLNTAKHFLSAGDPAGRSRRRDVSHAKISYSATSWSTLRVTHAKRGTYSILLSWMRKRQNKKFQSYSKGFRKDILERYKMYTIGELKAATNNFDGREILSEGKHVVYKGTLSCGKACAIKTSTTCDGAQETLNEVNFLSQLRHKNIVRLLGFCAEAEYPITVHEYMVNDPLSRHIQENSFSWEKRIKISCEIAKALSYLHASLSYPIIHGDVKASNILLDDDYTAKISDFGSALIPRINDESHMSIDGTPGHIDPEYFHTGRITCQSDVYSFGVVLAQLLTGTAPTFNEKGFHSKSLAEHFTWVMNNNLLEHFVDEKIADKAFTGQIKVAADMALKCLNLRGEQRPSMTEVARKLEILQRKTE